jgi:hypothetical protein
MRRLSFLTTPHSYLIVLIFFIASCKENKSSEAKTDTVDTTTKTAVPGDNKAGILTGSLDTLWIDATTFLALGNGNQRRDWTIFRYYLDNSNSITLAGWSANNGNGQFHGNNAPPPSPSIVLLKGNPSSIKYGPGDYFGNLILRPVQIARIKTLINSTNSNSVLFAPADPALNNHQITYTIFLSGSKNKEDISANLVPTYEGLNPSPPRNSN